MPRQKKPTQWFNVGVSPSEREEYTVSQRHLAAAMEKVGCLVTVPSAKVSHIVNATPNTFLRDPSANSRMRSVYSQGEQPEEQGNHRSHDLTVSPSPGGSPGVLAVANVLCAQP